MKLSNNITIMNFKYTIADTYIFVNLSYCIEIFWLNLRKKKNLY
jgi:hypothetical protein